MKFEQGLAIGRVTAKLEWLRIERAKFAQCDKFAVRCSTSSKLVDEIMLGGGEVRQVLVAGIDILIAETMQQLVALGVEPPDSLSARPKEVA